jgi:hypothetical protein
VKCKRSASGFLIPAPQQLDRMAKDAAAGRTTAREEATAFWHSEDHGLVDGKRDSKADKRLVNRLKMVFAQAGKPYPWAGRRGRPIG